MDIRSHIQGVLERKKAAFIAYLTAGDPSLEVCIHFALDLQEAGVDILELGIPYSDPVADGPTNREAAQRALERGVNVAKVLELCRAMREVGLEIPLVLFTYLNPVLKMGVETFAAAAKKAGVNGVLTVDLPPEEAEDYVSVMRNHELDTIFLATPTTSAQRLPKIDAMSKGFVYYVSRCGTTGAQNELSSTLPAEMKQLRDHIKQPLALGFGISTPQQVAQASELADAVVVGSAFGNVITNASDEQSARAALKELAKKLLAPLL